MVHCEGRHACGCGADVADRVGRRPLRDSAGTGVRCLSGCQSMWVESSVLVGDHPVGLSVHLLESDECDQTAAAIAWFAVHAVDGAPTTDPAAWQAFFERVISPYVAFTVSEENVDGLGPAWWSEAAARALAAFVRANRLESAVGRHVQILEGAARSTPRAS